jgi:NAD(P)-dependent dehydrogenase (short-subunit alcohol dehydrogenase family)
LSTFGRLDVLVTSAGVQARGMVGELSAADLRACLDVNVVGTWLACRAAAVPMREAGYGRILTLASALGLVGAAAAAARLVLNAGESPPAAAASEDAALPYWPRSPSDHQAPRTRR